MFSWVPPDGIFTGPDSTGRAILIDNLYRAEAEWKRGHITMPEEIAFHPDDLGMVHHVLGYAAVADPDVPRGSFEFRRVQVTRQILDRERTMFGGGV